MGRIRRFVDSVVSKLRELGRLTPIALVTMLLPMLGSSVLLVVGYPLGNWLRDNWQVGSPAFLAGVLFFCGFALLPTNLIGILAGWSFGFWLGEVLLITGVVGSAVIAFYVNLKLTPQTIPALAARNARVNAIYKALVDERFAKTTAVITLLRMSVAMPFAFSNFFLAAARVPVLPYIVGTFLGMLPRTTAMVFLGTGLSDLSFDNFNDVTFLVAGVPATIILIILVTVFSRRALDRLTLEAGGRTETREAL